MDEMTMSLAGAVSLQPNHADVRPPAAKQSTSTGAENAKVEAAEVYYSPKGRIDPSSGLYVLQVRDSESGEVIQQYPKEKGAQDYRRAADASASSTAAAPVPAAPVAAPATDGSDAGPAPTPVQTPQGAGPSTD